MKNLFLISLFLLTSYCFGSENSQSYDSRLVKVDGKAIILRLETKAKIEVGSKIKFYENISGIGDIDIKGEWVVDKVVRDYVRGHSIDNAEIPQLGSTAHIFSKVNEIYKGNLLSPPPKFEQNNHGPPLWELNESENENEDEDFQQMPIDITKNKRVVYYHHRQHFGVFLGNRDKTSGAYVLNVLENSSAENGGIVIGDLITNFNNSKITSVKDLLDKVSYCIPGRYYTVQVIRNNMLKVLNIKMQAMSLSWSCFLAGIDYEKGRNVEKKDPSFALKLIKKAEELGNPDAAYNLGLKYYKGSDIVESDAEKCIYYIKKAAKGRCFEAKDMLGYFYRYGKLLNKDEALARKWFLQAQAFGSIQSAENLGYMYYNGKGGAVDKKRAVTFWTLAAQFGLPQSQSALAHMYYFGEGGLSKNLTKAEYWAKKASATGNQNAKELLAKIDNSRQIKIIPTVKPPSKTQRKENKNEKMLNLFLNGLSEIQKLRRK